MAANTDKYRINEIFKLAANLFLELGNFRVYSQHNVLINAKVEFLQISTVLLILA